jgi:hypothetical protein
VTLPARSDNATPNASDTPTAPPAAAFDDPAYETITRMVEYLGLALIPMPDGGKNPPPVGFPSHPGLSVDEAYDHHAAGGNLAAVMGTSRVIWFDCENAPATALLLQQTGAVPFAIPAKAQYTHDTLAIVEGDDNSGKPNTKRGGCHIGLALPAHIDPKTLPHDTIGIELEGGGVVDVLAGSRYAMVPPSRLAVAPGVAYAPAAGGSLDPAVDCPDALPEAWPWLFDRSMPCPPDLAPLHGILTPRQPMPARDRVGRDARSSELDALVDGIPWDQWVGDLAALTYTGRFSGCGCPEAHFQGASTTKSMTLHEGCGEWGAGAHIWSGTMIAAAGLDGDHVSRAALRMALTGEDFIQACGGVGLTVGGADEDRMPLQPVNAEMFLAHATDAAERGDHGRAAELKAVADQLRAAADANREKAIASGETFTSGPVLGAASDPASSLRLVPHVADAAEDSEEQPAQESDSSDDGDVESGVRPAHDPKTPDDGIPPAKAAIWRKVKKLGFNPCDRVLYPEGFHSTPEILEAVMDYSDRTRAIFHQARRNHGVHPITMYIADLIRFGTRLPTDLGPFPGTPLSTYAVAVGRSGTGKTQSARPDLSVWDWTTIGVVWRNHKESGWQNPMVIDPEYDPNHTRRLGSGQVLVDLFGKKEQMFDEETGAAIKGKHTFVVNARPVVHVHEDEISAMVARSTGAQNTSMQTLCTAWARAPLGDSSRSAGTDMDIDPLSDPYNLFFSGGLQPRKSALYFRTEDVGFVQRCVHCGVTDPYRHVGLPVLSNPGAVPPPSLVIGNETVFTLCESITEAIALAGITSAIDGLAGASDLDSHILMVQIRLACLVAAFHGTLTVSEECWAHTMWLMEHSRRSREYARAAKDGAAEDEAVELEKLRVTGKRAGLASDRERVEKHAMSAVGAILAAGERGISQSDVRKVLPGNRRNGLPSERARYWDDTLKSLERSETVHRVGSRWFAGAASSGSVERPLQPVPPIRNHAGAA